jgi:hypothetical protein
LVDWAAGTGDCRIRGTNLRIRFRFVDCYHPRQTNNAAEVEERMGLEGGGGDGRDVARVWR